MGNHQEIFQYLFERNFAIRYEDVVRGEIDDLVGQGLFAFIFCEGGRRSHDVAFELSSIYKIPSVSLGGGLYDLRYHMSDGREFKQAIDSIRRVSAVTTILTAGQYEFQHKSGILSLLGEFENYPLYSQAVLAIANKY